MADPTDDSASSAEAFIDITAHEGRRRWPGLSFFREHEHAHFFGRDKEIEELLRLFERPKSGQNAAVWMHGDPGSGRTSLACAGLIPKLRESWGEDIRALQLMPEGGETGRGIIEGIAESILFLAPTDSTIDEKSRLRQFELLLEEDRTEAADFLAACYRRSSDSVEKKPGDSICLIFLDDLDKMAPEENGRIFPSDDDGWVTDHLGELFSFLHLLTLTGAFPCLISMRTPNVATAKEALAKIGKSSFGSWVKVEPFDPSLLRPFFETSPALADEKGSTPVTISEEMLDIIMLDVKGRPESVPFVSESLRERCLDSPGAVQLTVDDHNHRGSGIRRQHARIAAEAMEKLSPDAAAEFPRLMTALHPPLQGDGFITVSYLSLVNDQPAMRELVDTLVDHRVLRLTGETHADSKIAFTLPNAVPEWSHARDWLENDASISTQVEQYTEKLDDWKANDRTPVLLIHAPKALARAREILKYHEQRPFLSQELVDYFTESMALSQELDGLQKQINQKKYLLYGGVGLGAVALIVVLCLVIF